MWHFTDQGWALGVASSAMPLRISALNELNGALRTHGRAYIMTECGEYALVSHKAGHDLRYVPLPVVYAPVPGVCGRDKPLAADGKCECGGYDYA